VPEGQVPGTGATLAALTAAADRSPVMIGKPEPTLMQLAMARMGSVPETTAALGDRPETDILSAQRAEVLSILALSGATDRARLSAIEVEPDMVIEDIRALTQEWERALNP
jgi:ribonucleotide monophosphatase NagD (HAD superfamily)